MMLKYTMCQLLQKPSCIIGGLRRGSCPRLWVFILSHLQFARCYSPEAPVVMLGVVASVAAVAAGVVAAVVAAVVTEVVCVVVGVVVGVVVVG